MQSLVAIVASAAIFLGLGPGGNAGPGGRLEIRDSSELVEPAAQTSRRIRWPKKTIEVAFSTSLLTPVAHIKPEDRKSTRLNSSHSQISYAVFCLKKKKKNKQKTRNRTTTQQYR